MIKTINYRPEIDGLRAIAVLPVIFFHSGINLFSGGFVGVDIFFVISGYLITSIILRDLDEKNFSIVNFYERRARRILPALFFVILTTLALSWMLLPPKEMTDYFKSIVSVIFFSSNIYFWRTLDYFSPESEYIPLLHTWSLGVEEQFYIFYPLAVLLISRWKSEALGKCLLIATLFSFALCIFLSTSHEALNFYTLPSRAWELLTGSMAAYILHKKKEIALSPILAEITASVGLLLIGYAVFFLDEQVNYPSAWTLFPVLGTLLIILFGSGNTYVRKILSWRPIVLIGLISYSAYLWHQPILSYSLIGTGGTIDNFERTSVLILIFLLSYLTWHFIEKPFRNHALISRDRIFKYSSAAGTALLLIAVIGIVNSGFSIRYSAQVNLVAERVSNSPMRSQCHTSGLEYLRPSAACSYLTQNAQWAVLGDSHGVELSFALAEKLEQSGDGVKHLTFSACGPEMLYKTNVQGCQNWLRESVEWLKSEGNIQHVILAFNHIAHHDMERLIAIDSENQYKSLTDLYFESFEELVNALISTNKRVHIMLPVPKLHFHINYYLYPKPAFISTEKSENSTNGISTEYYIKTTNTIRERLIEIADKTNSELLDPMISLCDEINCYGVTGDYPNYFDEHHMSVNGASLVINGLKQ